MGALSRWRGAGRLLRAGGKQQADIQRWDLVAKTKDGGQVVFHSILCKRNNSSGLLSSEKSLGMNGPKEK